MSRRLLIRNLRMRRFWRLWNAPYSISDMLLIDRSKIAVLGLSRLSNVVSLIDFKHRPVMFIFVASSSLPPTSAERFLQFSEQFPLFWALCSLHSSTNELCSKLFNSKKLKTNTKKNFIFDAHRAECFKRITGNISLNRLSFIEKLFAMSLRRMSEKGAREENDRNWQADKRITNMVEIKKYVRGRTTKATTKLMIRLHKRALSAKNMMKHK